MPILGGEDVEINHDDGYGYSEDETHQQGMRRVRQDLQLTRR